MESIEISRIKNRQVQSDQVPVPDSKKIAIVKNLAKKYGSDAIKNYREKLTDDNITYNETMEKQKDMFKFMSDDERKKYLDRLDSGSDSLGKDSDEFFNKNGMYVFQRGYRDKYGNDRINKPGLSATIGRNGTDREYRVDYMPEK